MRALTRNSIRLLVGLGVFLGLVFVTGNVATAAKPDNPGKPAGGGKPVAAVCDPSLVTLYEGTVSRDGASPVEGVLAQVTYDASSDGYYISPAADHTISVVKVGGGADVYPNDFGYMPNPWQKGRSLSIAVCGEYVPPVDPPPSGEFSASISCADLNIDGVDYVEFMWTFTSDPEVNIRAVVDYENETSPDLEGDRGEDILAGEADLTMHFRALPGDFVNFQVYADNDWVNSWSGYARLGMTC